MNAKIDTTLSQYAPGRLKELNAMAREAGLPDWRAFLTEQVQRNPMGHSTRCPPSCRRNHNA